MAKEKKVSVKFFLNKDVKPSLYDDVKLYPVYVRVTYNRKNTKFKAAIDQATLWIREEFEDHYLLDEKNRKSFEEIEQALIDIVGYEAERLGDKFTLKGIGQRLEYYKISIYNCLQLLVSHHFNELLANHLTHNDYVELKDLELQEKFDKAASLLGDKLPTIITDQFILDMICHTLFSSYGKHISVYEWRVKEQMKVFYDHIDKILTAFKNDGLEGQMYKLFALNAQTLENANTDLIVGFIDQKLIPAIFEGRFGPKKRQKPVKFDTKNNTLKI